MELFLAIVLAVAVGALAFPPFRTAIKRWRAAEWPVAHGQISGVELEEIQDPEAGTYYRLLVRYRYVVGVRSYRGKELWQPLWGNSRFHLSQVGRQLEQGRKLRVRYQETDPSVSVIDGGIKSLLRDELAA